MAITWDIETEASISFAGLVKYFDSLGDRVLVDELDRSAEMLRRIHNNRSFLSALLVEQLADAQAFEAANPYTPQVFMLHKSTHYFIRAAVWVPPSGRLGEEIFFYEDPHDHNFSLLTLGYLGSGYRTVLFEYDHDEVNGREGEEVEVRFLEDTRLSEGRVLFYRPSEDIHVQFPSEEFSVSLNVIVPHSRNRQFSFEMDLDPSTRVAKVRENLAFYPPISVAKFARSFGVEDVAERLGSLLKPDMCPHTRRAIKEAMKSLGSP